MKINLTDLVNEIYSQSDTDFDTQKHGSGMADTTQLNSTLMQNVAENEETKLNGVVVLPFDIKRTGVGDFYIQMDGNNAGKPYKVKPEKGNYYAVSTDKKILMPDYFYYVVEYLFASGSFRPYIHGTTVPHLNIKGFTEAIVRHFFKKSK